MRKNMAFHAVGITALVVFAALGVATSPAPPSPCISELMESRAPLSPGDLVVGSIEAQFTSFHGGRAGLARLDDKHLPHYMRRSRIQLNTAAYRALLLAAQERFEGIVDVRDIAWIRDRRLQRDRYLFYASAKVVILEAVDLADLVASGRPLNPDERVIGSIEATFVAPDWGIVRPRFSMSAEKVPENRRAAQIGLNEIAYAALLEAAKNEFQAPVGVRDLAWSQWSRGGHRFHAWGKVVQGSDRDLPYYNGEQ